MQMPSNAAKLIYELPPADTNGRVMPVMGSMPMFMPILITTWIRIRDRVSKQMRLPISELACLAA